MTAEDRGLQFSTFNFDAFVEQLYPALICGASVVIRGKALWDSETFYRELIGQGISIVDLSTAYWFMLGKDYASRQTPGLRAPAPAQPGRRSHGGRRRGRLEKGRADGRLPAQYLRARPRPRSVPPPMIAEATCKTARALPSQIPLGKGCPGRSIYLLDNSGNLPLNGATGELMIGGDLLARGYHDRPGPDGGAFHSRSVQPGRRTPVPIRRPGALRRQGCDRLRRAYRPSGEDPRFPDRDGRDRSPVCWNSRRCVKPWCWPRTGGWSAVGGLSGHRPGVSADSQDDPRPGCGNN